MEQPWYRNAIIYALDVETFMDSDGDGIGDFPGLISRLDYLAGLGVTCIWLLPFYPSPNRDDGYDVTDFFNVDPRLGTLGDFVQLVREARERGLRVIVDLVVQHTSNEHPWFESARQPGSRHRDFYIWTDNPDPQSARQVVFEGEQEDIWTFDEAVRRYYRHRFYKFQPDLNFWNPQVRREIERIMTLWLELGISGFRIDAVPFLIADEGVEGVTQDEGHAHIRELRDQIIARRADAVLLAEADTSLDTVGKFFGDGDEMHMIFNFILSAALFHSLATHDPRSIARALHDLHRIAGQGQMTNFLRNHDELNLGALGEHDRDEVYRAFAPDESMRSYGRGIRRRLAPMFDGEQRRLSQAFSLMLAMPGTPMIYYGEEIGMGDDLSLESRLAVRTPMQWSPRPGAGFSKAPPDRLVRPLAGGPFGPEHVNVASQERDADSMLATVQRLIRARRKCHEIGIGDWRTFDTDHQSVLALGYESPASKSIVLHNLGNAPVTARIECAGSVDGRFVEIARDQDYGDEWDMNSIDLGAYGFRWFTTEPLG